MNNDNVLGHSYGRGKMINYTQLDKSKILKYDKEDQIKALEDFKQSSKIAKHNLMMGDLKNYLTKELKYHRHFTLGIDFDDTLVDEAFPEIGALKKDADKYINMMYDLGFNIIINTCRADQYQEHAEEFLKEKGIKYHQINCNLPQSVDYYKQDCRKISADIYIDDKCLIGLPSTWEEIFYLTIEKANKYYEKATLG